MTNAPAILLFIATVAFVLLWFVYWLTCHAAPKPLKTPLTDDRRFTRADRLCVLGITAVYAVVAFVGLGSTDAPQSFYDFSAAGESVTLDLGEAKTIGNLRYYCGLGTGSYTMDLSTDGSTWVTLPSGEDDGKNPMTQEYTQLFRWNDLWVGYNDVRYIRLTADAALSLGELALYDGDGAPIAAETVSTEASVLLDEQDIIPAFYTFQNGTYFDEIYHARTAYEHIESVWPYEITHPPLGKLILGLGIRLFGMTPFGWRFSGTLMGVLMLPALYIFLKKLFSNTLVCASATTVFAFDFMHFTQTRLATIDSYVTLFILLMYLFMWLWLSEPEGKRRLLWLGLCGLSFGLGVASKWTGLYAGAGLAILWAYHWIRRYVRSREGFWPAFGKNVAWCLLFFVAVPALIYYLSYYAYGTASGLSGIGMFFSKDYLRIVLDNQSYMWNYHSGLVAEHPYASRWFQWLLDARPILYYLQSNGDGTHHAFGAFNNPLLSWLGLLAVIAMGMKALAEKDKRAGFILFGYLANLLPWVPVSRLTFAYHYFPCTLFLTLSLGSLFDDLRRSGHRWKKPVCAVAIGCVVLFGLFYPVLSGVRVSDGYTSNVLKWMSTWPF